MGSGGGPKKHGGEKAKGKGGVEEEEQEEMDEDGNESPDQELDTSSFKTLCRLSAQMAMSAHHVAQVAKVVGVDVHLTKRSSPVITNMKAATKAYSQYVEKLPQGEKGKADPPHIGAWDALVQTCRKAAEEAGMEKDLKLIDRHLAEVQGMGTAEEKKTFLTEQIRYCRIAPAYAKGDAKLEVAVRYIPGEMESHTSEAWAAMKRVMRGPLKCQAKAGVAPRSNIERRMTRLMTKMGIYKNQNRSEGGW